MNYRGTTILAVVLSISISANAQVKQPDTAKNLRLEEVSIFSKYFKRYKSSQLSEMLRLPTPLLNVPQNIQILSSEILRDQAVYNLNESVTRNVSGTLREELHNGISPDIYSRGGYISAQRNGVDMRPLGKGPLADDISIIETVEFLKGPSNFMHAMSDPSGSYNIVTKKPSGQTRRTADILLGSFNMLRAAIDLDGQLDKSNKLQYRLNVMGMGSKGFLKHDRNSKILLAPSLKYKFNENTSLTAEYIYQHLNYLMLSEAQSSPYGYGTLPRDFTMTDPSIRPFIGKDHNAFLTFQNKFNKNWQMTAKVSYVNSAYDGSLFWVYGANPTDKDILDRNLVYDSNKYTVFSTQAYINGAFKTGNIKHQFIAGIDMNRKSSRSWDTWATATTIYPLSITNPVYSETILNNGIGGNFDSENNISADINKIHRRLNYTSIYAMDEIALLDEKLRISLGLRLTASDGKTNDYGQQSASKDWALTPRLGINYALNNSSAVYFLYDQTFLPQTGISVDGKTLKPLEGTSYEVGLKKDWANGSWNTTLSLYNIYRNRLITPDPTSNLLYQTGESQSKGIEFDLKGRIAKGTNVIFNYAYTDSKITKDDLHPANVGMATPNRVKHIQNTWINYLLPLEKLEGFTVSLGYQLLIGRTERMTTTTPDHLKDIFRLDSGIGWSNEKYNINFLVNNVLNSKIYSTAWRNNTGDMYYWVQQAPINARLSFRINL
ncbi:TonB-dependent siderophore receptor [Pedobacter gandavensis]|uniref:TonB-dependent siderophore receptor n=1 Tax=Pedobacter gandavensis TaxID=2679963 RepID=UPI00292D1F9E|nr:TonB-dependent receptor [Pedobacter gandavensis]